MAPRNNLAKIFAGASYQFSTVSKINKGTVGLKTTSLTGPSRTNFLAALLLFFLFKRNKPMVYSQDIEMAGVEKNEIEEKKNENDQETASVKSDTSQEN